MMYMKLAPAAMLQSNHHHERLWQEERKKGKCIWVHIFREDGPSKYPCSCDQVMDRENQRIATVESHKMLTHVPTRNVDREKHLADVSPLYQHPTDKE
ncbi:hypothetical protein KIN20_010284 [Parelaphostrongylus tenuis]|uniref:Uncharacterized protein n=1 Tax=Parelaphostrongylus tenuis TaxID=148309 RepID=A0AAD5QP09_PARTN|nr:hypothetical protein KIN20_010284 [Parelaphostrongylus tenuis]